LTRGAISRLVDRLVAKRLVKCTADRGDYVANIRIARSITKAVDAAAKEVEVGLRQLKNILEEL
jgi:hypothetical protein